jgi:hypothetical protein
VKYAETLDLSEEKFYRLTGVKRTTFETMLDILAQAHRIKKLKGGRPNKAEVPEMLMMTLEYLREYRTYFHIALNYGISESAAFNTIKWTENTLIKDGTFPLPGRKELLKADNGMEAVLIDVTESPVQRPKKNKSVIIPAKRSVIR